MDPYNNETITILLNKLMEKVEKVDDHVSSLSKGQGLLGGSYKELKEVCQQRWDRFLELEQKQKVQDEMKKSKLFSILFKHKETILSFIKWSLILGVVIYAFINNNSDLIKVILDKIHI